MRLLWLFLLIQPLCGEEIIFETRKKEIQHLEEVLKEVPSGATQSAVHFSLAKEYLEDQEMEKAFLHFLASLEKAALKKEGILSFQEEPFYKEAQDLYLKEGALNPLRAGEMLLERFSQVAEAHPEYYHLHLLLATAHGNTGNFLSFFENFYRVYPYLSEHFLSYKTEGILFLRLMHFAKHEQERDYFRTQGIHYIEKSLQKNPQDPSLYKMRLLLAKERKEEECQLRLLTQFVEKGVEVPRSDILFYVNEALCLKKEALAEKIVAKAATLYDYSRAVQLAQECIKTSKNF